MVKYIFYIIKFLLKYMPIFVIYLHKVDLNDIWNYIKCLMFTFTLSCYANNLATFTIFQIPTTLMLFLV